MVAQGGDNFAEYRLDRRIVTIGMSDDCDIRLRGRGIAPYHAIIRRLDEGSFQLSDMGSDTGLLVNERLLSGPYILKHGDRLSVGELQIAFVDDDDIIVASTHRTRGDSRDQQLIRMEALDAAALEQLKKMDPRVLEGLRSQVQLPVAANTLGAFVTQGMANLESHFGRGLFNTLITPTAYVLRGYNWLMEKMGRTVEDAFPEGTWQFYTQFGLREDPARHANESTGFHDALPPDADEVDMAAAWVYKSVITIFEYDTLLENEWVERVLLRLVDEAIKENIILERLRKRFPRYNKLSHEEREEMANRIWAESQEHIELESEQYKRSLGLGNLNADWVKIRPYKRPYFDYKDDILKAIETYPQYRRRAFLKFLAEALESLPVSLGATIWDRYREWAETGLPAYQKQMSILAALTPARYKDEKETIPLHEAKVGFISGGRYYLIDVVIHDDDGRVLAFDPGKPEDRGEPLRLTPTPDGAFVDEQGRRVDMDRAGGITIGQGEDSMHTRIKVMRPTPISTIRARVAAILRESRVVTPGDSEVDILIAKSPRDQQNRLRAALPRQTQHSISLLRRTPIIIHWDLRPREAPLGDIRETHRGIGDHALNIIRTESSFVFEQSHIFFDAIWGMALSQILTDGAIEAYDMVTDLKTRAVAPPPRSLPLNASKRFLKMAEPYRGQKEVVMESKSADLAEITHMRRALRKEANINLTVNDILVIYRTLHDKLYTPSFKVQQAMADFRHRNAENPAGRKIIADINRFWEQKREENPIILIPMDASFVDPKLRLYPTTFRTFFPDMHELVDETNAALDKMLFKPNPLTRGDFLYLRRRLFAHLAVLADYFDALKRITRNGESFSTAVIRMVAHLPTGMQDTLELIPRQFTVLGEVIKGEEVLSNVGQVAPTSSLVRFMSAEDDGSDKLLVWGIMSDSHGQLVITLRDFRPYIPRLVAMGAKELARTLTKDYLEAYALGLNSFSQDIRRIATTQIT